MVTGAAEPRARGTTLTGLSDADVAARIVAGAVNEVPTGPTRTVGEIVKSNVVTLFNILLGAMLVIVLIVAPIQDAMFGLVLIGNAAIGIIQELRAKKTLDHLALLSAPRASVIRNGRESEVPVNMVVLDDLLALKAGDQVVVDGVVVASESLEIDESLLTGESDAIMKERGDEVLSGTTRPGGWVRMLMPPGLPKRPASSLWSARNCVPASTGSCGASHGFWYPQPCSSSGANSPPSPAGPTTRIGDGRTSRKPSGSASPALWR